jgi:hypothetical protein
MEHQGTLSLALARGSVVPDDGLAIDLRRADIEMALGSEDDGVVELLLDLEAREMAGGTIRRQTLAVGCTPADLERMLEDASDSVRVSFDAEALSRAIDPDIEAHGLRETMAVLAVVVATTGAAAGTAQAMPSLGGQGGVSGAATAAARDMPADSLSASAASTQGAAATRANPSDAAAASIAQDSRLAEQARLDSYQDVVPSYRDVLMSGHHRAPVVATDPARDLPSDSVRASQPPPIGRGAAYTDSSPVDSSTFVVIVGGTALALLGAVFAAAAAPRSPKGPKTV